MRELDLNREGFKKGTRYEVTFDTGTSRRFFFGTFLGVNGLGQYDFNCRPAAGTISLSPGMVTRAREVSGNFRHSSPRAVARS